MWRSEENLARSSPQMGLNWLAVASHRNDECSTSWEE